MWPITLLDRLTMTASIDMLFLRTRMIRILSFLWFLWNNEIHHEKAIILSRYMQSHHYNLRSGTISYPLLHTNSHVMHASCMALASRLFSLVSFFETSLFTNPCFSKIASSTARFQWLRLMGKRTLYPWKLRNALFLLPGPIGNFTHKDSEAQICCGYKIRHIDTNILKDMCTKAVLESITKGIWKISSKNKQCLCHLII